jgi:hypothetical protein
MKFATSIRNNSKVVLSTINRRVYTLAFQLFTNVVRFTPSPTNPGDTAIGLLSNQWYPSVGTPSTALGTSHSSNGGESLSRINSMMNGMEFLGKDGKIYLSNNVPYAYRAEVLGWPKSEDGKPTAWSGRVGPYAMVAKAMAIAGTYKRIKI